MPIESFSASRASKHLACHASANLSVAIPGWQDPPNDGDTKASVKGTNMHAILEAAGQYTATEMMGIARAMLYVAELRKTRRFKMETELQGTGWWLSKKPRTTADVVLYLTDEIHVVDYKFGRIPVEVAGNAQLMFYALSFMPLAQKAKGVFVHIVQPFADIYDSVYFTAEELEQFRLDTIAADDAIQGGDVTFGPSDACKFCPANPHSRGAKGSPMCPAMIKMLYPHPLDEDAILDML